MKVPTSAEQDDQLAQLGRRQIERPHGMHHPHDGGDDTEGWQGIRHGGHDTGGQFGLMMMGIDFHIHQVFDLECIEIAAHHQAQVVAQELDDVMITRNLRIFGKQGARSGVSTSPSIDIKPSLRTLDRISYSSANKSMWNALP